MPLLDSELMYVRLNPRTHTVFGLGKIEVAFETISQFLQAHRYAGRLAANSVVQYALWMQDRTPEQHERLIQWWQDEVEGTGRVPVMSSETVPQVLRFGGGTDADLRLQWQQFLLTMIANAFDLPANAAGRLGRCEPLDCSRVRAGGVRQRGSAAGQVDCRSSDARRHRASGWGGTICGLCGMNSTAAMSRRRCRCNWNC